ncbi:MAG: carboxypeptidase regulatory-like domain-containing protein [Oscillospiraceae bacterium]
MNVKQIRIIILCTLIVVILCGAAVVLVSKGNDNSEALYNEKITYAQTCMEAGNYQEAVLAFLDAIDADDTNPEPYLALAKIYADNNQLQDAISLLERGYDKTGSQDIRDLLAEYRNKLRITQLPQDGNSASDESKSDTSQFELNTAYLNSLASTDFADYSADYTVNAKNLDGDMLTVTFVNLNLTMYYINDTQHSNVINYQTGKPQDDAVPNFVTLEDISVSLFLNMPEAITVDRLSAAVGANITREHDAEADKDLVVFTKGNCTVKIECDDNGTITSKTAWNKIILPTSAGSEKLPVKFAVANASNGNHIADADVSFSQNHQVVATGHTDADGNCTINLAAGEYEVTVTANGFITALNNLTVTKGIENALTVGLSTELSSDQMRIVLQWGAYPEDVDSYLTRIGNNSTYVYYGNMVADYATLDHDDTTSFGPETITITDLSQPYLYYIHDYMDTHTLGSSGATVTVYKGNTQIATFAVNTAAKDEWSVLKIVNGEVTQVNLCDEGVDLPMGARF